MSLVRACVACACVRAPASVLPWPQVAACALEEDIAALPAGDLTELGERGGCSLPTLCPSCSLLLPARVALGPDRCCPSPRPSLLSRLPLHPVASARIVPSNNSASTLMPRPATGNLRSPLQCAVYAS